MAPSNNSGPDIAVGSGLGASVVIGRVQRGVTGVAAVAVFLASTNGFGCRMTLYLCDSRRAQTIKKNIVFVAKLLL